MKPDIKRKINDHNPHKIKDLQLENGRLSTIPFQLQDFVKLRSLSLFNNRLTSIPDFFNNFIHLSHLNLSNNSFQNIPEQILSCKRLKVLLLRSNRINNLIGINKFEDSLEKLDLSSNKLNILRTDFSKFLNLKDVDISDNEIGIFPKSLPSNKLKSLKISSNKLKNIPKEISKYKSLVHLDLSYNQISKLPEEICQLSQLKTLNLTGNQISSLPENFGNLKNLKELSLNGNPIGEVPVEIASQGLNGVLNYYLHLGVSVKLNEAKLLVVGQGAVGKTYLLNKIITGTTPETYTTEGIDIQKWFINSNDFEEQETRINAWDFGGQEIYHSTHQFFLTKRSLYLFVWEARKDESLINFDYWLNIINILSNASPVIVVLNKIDQRVKQIDEKSLVEKFPNIQGFVSVSAFTGQGISDLIELVKENIANLPHIGDKLPKVWSEIRNTLECLDDNYITYSKYLEICNSLGLNRKQSAHLSKYFHDLGVYLHFHDNIVLRPVVFLKPEWATNCVYKILDLHSVINNYGVFTCKMLDNELVDYNTEQISYIIELMKKFELCFEFSKDTFLIPELLRTEAANADIELNGSISFVYKYEFMPAGILPRLIVRLKDLIYKKSYWKYGAYITFSDSIGLVKSNQYERTITIKVSGTSRADLLTIIRREVEYINSTLNYPHHEKKIMCCCDKCQKNENPFMFDFEFLEKAKRRGIKSVICQNSIKDVDLFDLIGPYETSVSTSKEEFGFNSNNLTYDLIEISTRLLERKHSHKIEDLITDNFTDNLRSKNYIVTDQTRSGKAKKLAGELDIMIRNPRNMPIAILEAMKLTSFGMGNKTIIEHINKVLIDYDTNGLPRNFIMIYAKTNDFSDFFSKYQKYIGNLSDHFLYKPETKLIAFNVNTELSSRSNIRIIVSHHNVNDKVTELYHILLNMD